MEEFLKNVERLSRNKDSVFREEEDGAFLFDPDTGNLKFINGMGVNIYQLCDGKMTVGDITSLVSENYRDISEKKIEEDVRVFLQELVKMEFLKREESGNDAK